MEYRVNKKTGDKVSVIGLGTSYIADTPEKETLDTLVAGIVINAALSK